MLPESARAAGKIICISSVHEKTPWAGLANYRASKGGVSILMASMAQELGAQRIRVNGIAPGGDQDRHQPRCVGHAAGRGQSAATDSVRPRRRCRRCRKAAVWLASDESDYVTGATLYVDGGMTLYPAFWSNG